MKNIKKHYIACEKKVFSLFERYGATFARLSVFVVFFWFGLIKLLDLSPASPMAQALTEKTVGLEYYDMLFFVLAAVECAIGLLFLVPKFTRVAFAVLIAHLVLVSSPLVLVPDYTWQQFAVPTLEGQYIIKNITIVALAIMILLKTRTTVAQKKK